MLSQADAGVVSNWRWCCLELALVLSQTGTGVISSQRWCCLKPALVLVRDGPYRFTRNPMYAGMVLMLVALGLLFSVDYTLPIAPLLWLVLHVGVVLREETYLIGKFGARYQSYLDETRRWI